MALAAAAVLALTTLPTLSVQAASAEAPTAIQGDVDKDGVVTGHDTAMVARYCNADSAALTEVQITLADINADGVVDQTDVAAIQELEIFRMGDAFGFEQMTIDSAVMALRYYSEVCADNSIDIVDEEIPEIYPEEMTSFSWERSKIEVNGKEIREWQDGYANLYQALSFSTRNSDCISQFHLHLLDTDGDDAVTIDDAYRLLQAYATERAGGDPATAYDDVLGAK